MAGKGQENRIFVGGLSFDITERQLENAFNRFGKILDCQVMLERDTGRPRGFGFLTFADWRAMEDAIREMHGREFGDRVISVNRAQPRLGSEDPTHGFGYPTGGRSRYCGGDRLVGQDECFKCGRLGHWARDCPSVGGARGTHPFTPPRSRFGGAGGGQGDLYGSNRDRSMDDRYDRARYGDRVRYNSRDDRYTGRDRYPLITDRFAGDRYGSSERYPQYGYAKERGYERDAGPRGSSDRYGRGGPARYEGSSYRDRPGPYDRPLRRGGRPPSLEHY